LAIFAYVILVAVLVSPQARGRARSAFEAFIVSSVFAVVVHPLLLPALLPRTARAPYVQFVERIRLPVGAGRIGFHVVPMLTVVSLLQAAILVSLAARANGKRS
jgi:hydrogenase-4 membrane subunit HyfE